MAIKEIMTENPDYIGPNTPVEEAPQPEENEAPSPEGTNE